MPAGAPVAPMLLGARLRSRAAPPCARSAGEVDSSTRAASSAQLGSAGIRIRSGRAESCAGEAEARGRRAARGCAARRFQIDLPTERPRRGGRGR
jgi:hypothetical protein